jgi:hypothetical protein
LLTSHAGDRCLPICGALWRAVDSGPKSLFVITGERRNENSKKHLAVTEERQYNWVNNVQKFLKQSGAETEKRERKIKQKKNMKGNVQSQYVGNMKTCINII